MVRNQSHSPHSGICSRPVEYSRRPAESKGSDSPHRVDVGTQCSSSLVDQVGQSTNRPICDPAHQSSSDLHLSRERPSGVCSECLQSVVGGNVSLCLSTNSPSHESFSQVQARPPETGSHHSGLAAETLVSRAPSSQPRASSSSGSRQKRSSSTKKSRRSHQSKRAFSDRLDTLRSCLRARNLNEETVRSLLKSRRVSTLNVYTTRWRHWYSYCQTFKIDPIYPSVDQFANFLQHLYTSKRLAPGTIAGYRSCIAHTVSLIRDVKTPSFSSSFIISNLLDSFRRQAPARIISVPKWDPFIVLAFLRDKCEPLPSLSLQWLTFKTVFLLGLALASRVSGLHAISGLAQDIEFHSDSVTLHFLPEFRAKAQPSD